MSHPEKMLYNANAGEFFTHITGREDKKRKEAKKIDRRVCCG